jgi:hypothetical protein
LATLRRGEGDILNRKWRLEARKLEASTELESSPWGAIPMLSRIASRGAPSGRIRVSSARTRRAAGWPPALGRSSWAGEAGTGGLGLRGRPAERPFSTCGGSQDPG